MADIEKVIEALHCRGYDDDFPCSICAYYRPDEKPVAKCDYRGLMDDAIDLLKEQKDLGTELTNAVELIHKKNERIEKLLKEQEAVEPYVTGRGETFETAETWWYACGNCHEALDVNDKYCRHCGRSVKWG